MPSSSLTSAQPMCLMHPALGRPTKGYLVQSGASVIVAAVSRDSPLYSHRRSQFTVVVRERTGAAALPSAIVYQHAIGSRGRSMASRGGHRGDTILSSWRPTVQAMLLAISPTSYLLVLTYHHLLGDAVSSLRLRRDLLTLCRCRTRDKIPKELISSSDCSEIVSSEASSEHISRRLSDLGRRNEISYSFGCIVEPATCDDVNFGGLVVPFQLLGATLARLSGAPFKSTIKPDAVRPARVSSRPHWLRLNLNQDLSAAVGDIARPPRVTPFIVDSAVLHLLVPRYSGQPDALIGFLSAHRGASNRSSLGLYSQTFIQRLSCSDNPTGAKVVHRLREDVLKVTEHGYARLE
jgi:hypothetical protein